MKMCVKCGSVERASSSYCRGCWAEYSRQWNELNKKNRKEINAKYYQKVKEERARQYQQDRIARSEDCKKRYAANPEPYKERAAASKARRRSEDLDGFKAAQAEYVRNRRAASEKEVIHNRISCGVRDSLKRKGGSKRGRAVLDLLGFTLDQLTERLRSTLPSGYSWDDFLSGDLHIDHILPVAAFNFSSPGDPDFKRCWALSNLRLLPALDNIRKGARVEHPFQPSLSFGDITQC